MALTELMVFQILDITQPLYSLTVILCQKNHTQIGLTALHIVHHIIEGKLF